ncbi:MAG: transporter substrate-binding domain-containing protein, partial [Planctomycetota bacterium]
VQWQETPFPELIPAVATGKIDVAVSTIGITEQRAQKVLFSKPYFETAIVALVKPDSKFQSLSDLKRATIGADETTTAFKAAKTRWPDTTFVTKAWESTSWPEMVHSGTIDAFIVDASDQDRIESNSGLQLRRIRTPLQQEKFAVALSPKQGKLKHAIEKTIDQLAPRIPLIVGGETQLVTALGKSLTSRKDPDAKLIDQYLLARIDTTANPDDEMKTIWFGRRAGYLQRMNEAITVFTEGLKRHAGSIKLLRHRGHRYVSTRQFEKAIADLESAAASMRNQPDQVEPDGMPNLQGIPLTTTHGNVWYHLGLAYYLNNDMENSLRCYNERLSKEKYDDSKVANAYWRYMILRRLGKTQKARQAVASITPGMTILENHSYHQMCLFFKGDIGVDDLPTETDGKPVPDVYLYALANWHLFERDDQAKAKLLLDKLLATGTPFSFAYIAGEADYVRLFGSPK